MDHQAASAEATYASAPNEDTIMEDDSATETTVEDMVVDPVGGDEEIASESADPAASKKRKK